VQVSSSSRGDSSSGCSSSGDSSSSSSSSSTSSLLPRVLSLGVSLILHCSSCTGHTRGSTGQLGVPLHHTHGSGGFPYTWQC
jgi:hypothetical protein